MKSNEELISVFISAFCITILIVIFLLFVIAAIREYRRPYVNAPKPELKEIKDERTWSEFFKDLFGGSGGGGGPCGGGIA